MCRHLLRCQKNNHTDAQHNDLNVVGDHVDDELVRSNHGDFFLLGYIKWRRFLSRLADRSHNECKSEPRKFLQNDNKFMQRMPGWHHQTFIFLSHFCNEAIGYLAKRDDLPR
jgi:hypothetical protein